MYDPDDCLMISGLQHFRFCRRQWALIHIEQQWTENLRTTEGALLHERAHDEQLRESRGDRIIARSLRVYSLTLGLSGQCDVVEFRRDAQGITLHGHDGLWLPYPIEYKRGHAKQDGCDELQLLFNGPLSPIKLLPLEGEAFTVLVLPVRLKSGD